MPLRTVVVKVSLVRVAGLAVLALVAGCSPARPPVPAPPSSPAPSSPAPSYRVTGNLCDTVDTAGLARALGRLLTRQPEAPVGSALVTTVNCSFRFGPPAAPVPVEVSMQLTTSGGSAADYFNGLRKVSERDAVLTRVPGLGQDAYRYTNGLGPHLATYDDNLYLSFAAVTGALPPGRVPSGIDAALATSARNTMAKLAQ